MAKLLESTQFYLKKGSPRWLFSQNKTKNLKNDKAFSNNSAKAEQQMISMPTNSHNWMIDSSDC